MLAELMEFRKQLLCIGIRKVLLLYVFRLRRQAAEVIICKIFTAEKPWQEPSVQALYQYLLGLLTTANPPTVCFPVYTEPFTTSCIAKEP